MPSIVVAELYTWAYIQDDPAKILAAIETLESESDAKCHSSANRFEDFIYGTPLADEGRWFDPATELAIASA